MYYTTSTMASRADNNILETVNAPCFLIMAKYDGYGQIFYSTFNTLGYMLNG
jgi:hypothetical protein